MSRSKYVSYDNEDVADGAVADAPLASEVIGDDADLVEGLTKAFPEVRSATADSAASVVYNLNLLSTKRPGPVLAVGYGNPLKNVVRAATNFEVAPLFATSTDDKKKAFSFGGLAETVSVGVKFDPKLFENECAILTAAEECGARTLLCAQNVKPSELLAEECIRRDILLLTPIEGDRTLGIWRRVVPEGTIDDIEVLEEYKSGLDPVEWRRCSGCGMSHDDRAVVAHGYRCPDCGKLARLSSDERALLTFDEGSVQEWDAGTAQTDALDFPDFDSIIQRAKDRSGHEEGVFTGRASIEGIDVAFGIMEPSFMMGSMGHVVGERLASMFEKAADEGLPVIVFCASGGARMQEGLVSLMQMAKVSAAVKRHSEAGLLYISALSDPTTGGVTASFATLGDIIVAEPGANIGFAGRRVIRDTIKQALPDDFQTAEFALEHGMIDAIVKREEMRQVLASMLRLHGYAPAPSYVTSDAHMATTGAGDASAASADSEHDDGFDPSSVLQPQSFEEFVGGLSGLAGALGQAITEQTTRASHWWKLRNKGIADIPYMKPGKPLDDGDANSEWASVQLARNTKRPTSSYYINTLFDDFIELHGDRTFADDGAIIGGIGRLGDKVVTVIAEEKGTDLNDRISRNFGCPQPEGYRKAMRLMDQAQKFGRPIVCLVDTQGAFCGMSAEERGIGTTIAESLAKLSDLEVPVVSVVIGEGGSGGALALAVGNKVAMQENAVYSVLSPEGFASILWKDGSRAPEAAEVMKVGANDALEMGIVEDVIVEGHEAAHENPDQAAAALWLYLNNALDELSEMSPEELKAQRYDRFRKF